MSDSTIETEITRPKLTITLLHENAEYCNILFFSSDNKDIIERYKNEMSIAGNVYEFKPKGYPLVMRRLLEKYGPAHLGGKYFVFRTLYDTSKNDVVNSEVAEDIFRCFTNPSSALLHVASENRLVKIISEMVVRGSASECEMEMNEIFLDETDILSISTEAETT